MTQEAVNVLRVMVDMAPTPMWLIEPDGSVALVNEPAATVLGYHGERDLIGRSSHQALHARRADGSPYPSHQCPIVTTSNTISHARTEEFIDRRGRTVPVQWTLHQLDSSHKLLTFSPTALPRGGTRAELPARPRPELDVETIRAHITAHCADTGLTPARVAQRFGLSLRSLQVMLSRAGTSPAQEIRVARLGLGHQLLTDGLSVTETAFASGFNDVGTFSRSYRRAFNRRPVSTKCQHAACHPPEAPPGHSR